MTLVFEATSYVTSTAIAQNSCRQTSTESKTGRRVRINDVLHVHVSHGDRQRGVEAINVRICSVKGCQGDRSQLSESVIHLYNAETITAQYQRVCMHAHYDKFSRLSCHTQNENPGYAPHVTCWLFASMLMNT